MTLLRALALTVPAVAGAADCNGNGKSDASDIQEGRSADLNSNLVPDECETAPLGFGNATDVALGTSPRSFVVADWNGDHRADIAVVFWRDEREGPGVAIVSASDDGTFQASAQPSGPSVSKLAAGDLDGDGDLDIAAVDSSAVWALLNDGRGAFPRAVRLIDADGIAGLAVGSLDADGAADIAVTRRPDDVLIVVRGGLDGAFSRPAVFPAGTSPGALVLLDADGDRDLDVATACQQPGGIQLLTGGGDGAFTLGARLEAGGIRPEFLATGDWNADGFPDLAAATRFAFEVVPNAGGGTFGDAVPFALGRDIPPLRGLAPGDADGDGDIDIAAGLASSPPGALFVWNRGDGAFHASSRLSLGASPIALDLKDLNGDGDLDLVVSPYGAGGLQIIWHRDAKAAADPGALDFSSETFHFGFEPHSCALRDLDGDKDLDIAIIDGETNLKILKNDGNGVFSFHRNYEVLDSLEMISVAAADLDADGDIDIVLADESTNNVLVLLNKGDGTLRQKGTYHAGERPTQVSAGDLTGDGTIDLLCVNQESNSLSIFEASGGGAFKPAKTVHVNSRPQAAAMGEFDGDGALDIAVACYGASEVQVLFGDGRGKYERRRSYPVRGPTFVAAADLDGDGRLDLSAACYASRQVAVLLNKGGDFTAASALDVGAPPFTLLHADLDGDGRPDIVTSNTAAGSVSALRNLGGGGFAAPLTYAVGVDPRFAMAGDIDADGDIDIVSANHTSLDLTVLTNRSQKATPRPRYLERVCTEAELHGISLRASADGSWGSPVLRETKFVVPADAGDPSLLPTTFQDVNRQPLHLQFLAEAFPEKFPALSAEAYDALTGRRASRKYWSGILRSLRTPKGPVYSFSVLGDFADDPAELPRPAEVRAVYETLSKAFALRPLAYFPEPGVAREDAARWKDPGFPVEAAHAPSGPAYASYTRGVSFGRVRVLTQEAFLELNAKGGLSYQDILVLERAPRDIEGVVAGVITAEPQGELSHLALRTARRGTPNAFATGAPAALRALDGKLARLEVGERGYSATEAGAPEASAWWGAHRPKAPILPAADTSYDALDSLAEMDLSSEAPAEARYGGKASNLARLSRIFDGPFEKYREKGFAIPMRCYSDFIRSSRVPSARDPSREVSAAEFLTEVAEWPEFQSDSRLRFATLQRFRESLEAAGKVDSDLVARIARRVREVFGTAEKTVRFRSSSNVEDALEFNGAGLYDSTSACAADDLDGDEDGPCRCDPSKPVERGIARALKRVWSSLWNFRAYEERAYYDIPQDKPAMAILVSAAFPDERANGVAMTGNPQDPLDARYIVTAQARGESVVSPEPGVLAERDLLELSGGAVAAIARAQPSSLVAAGQTVLSDRELAELGAILWHINERLPIDLGGRNRGDVLLDVEFKVDSEGSLAVKQVRPFLRKDAAAPAPMLELDVPPGAEACGVFVPSRAPQRSYELKAQVRFAAGKLRLPAREEPSPFGGDSSLFEELRVGPDQGLAVPAGAAKSQVIRVPSEGGDAYRVRCTQAFTLSDGRTLDLEMLLDFPASAGDSTPPRVVLDEETLTRKVSLQGNLGLVVTFSSCTYGLLPLWEVDAELDGGIGVNLLERHEPPPTLNDTGPAALVRAEVKTRGATRVVEDYWRLVYTSLRHNRAVRYWIVLDPPLEVDGLAKPASVLELVAPEPKLGIEAQARLLDGDHQPLGTRKVLSFRREPISTPASAPIAASALPCLRGDANGDGAITVADCALMLGHVLFREPPPACAAAMDLDSNGAVTPTDAALFLLELFEFGRAADATPEAGKDRKPARLRPVHGGASERASTPGQ